MSEDELIKVSNHGSSRWHQWTDSPGLGPVVAWNDATTLPSNHGLYCDEARYHSDTETVLLVSPDDDPEPEDEDDVRVLVTVIDANTCKSQCRSAIDRVSNDG